MKCVYFITIQKRHIIYAIIFLFLTILFILFISTFIPTKKVPSFLHELDTEVIAQHFTDLN